MTAVAPEASAAAPSASQAAIIRPLHKPVAKLVPSSNGCGSGCFDNMRSTENPSNININIKVIMTNTKLMRFWFFEVITMFEL